MSGSKGQTPSAADAGLLQMQFLLDTHAQHTAMHPLALAMTRVSRSRLQACQKGDEQECSA